MFKLEALVLEPWETMEEVLNDIATAFLEQLAVASRLETRQEMVARPAGPIKESKAPL